MQPTATHSATERVIDFRYAPRRSWTLIGRPLDHHKSLVREDGAPLYGFRQAQFKAWTFDRVIALRAQTEARQYHDVNALSPGIVEAGMVRRQLETDPGYAARAGTAVPLGRLQTADEVARIAAWLSSDAATYLTGSVILADGGASLRVVEA